MCQLHFLCASLIVYFWQYLHESRYFISWTSVLWFISHLDQRSSTWPKNATLLSNIQGAGSREWERGMEGTPENTNKFAGTSGLRGRCDEGRCLGKLVLFSSVFQMGTYSFKYQDLKYFIDFLVKSFANMALLFTSQIRARETYWVPVVYQTLFSDPLNEKHRGNT